MYNLTNSPNGPLGGAGQSNNSTMPRGLFANASPAFNNFGKGLESFTNNVGAKAKGVFGQLFGNLFGGDGGMANDPTSNGGAPSLFGQPGQPGAQGQPTVQGPMGPVPGQLPGMNPMQSAMARPTLDSITSMNLPGPARRAAEAAQGGGGGGILSRFMGR
jgi:hypothetical protein